jgi:hypothetical protein
VCFQIILYSVNQSPLESEKSGDDWNEKNISPRENFEKQEFSFHQNKLAKKNHEQDKNEKSKKSVFNARPNNGKWIGVRSKDVPVFGEIHLICWCADLLIC